MKAKLSQENILRMVYWILNFYEWARKKHFVSLKLKCQSGIWTRDLRFSKQAAKNSIRTPAHKELHVRLKSPSSLLIWSVPIVKERAARGLVRNYRWHTGFNLSSRPSLTWSPSHIENGEISILSDNHIPDQRGSNPECMHAWRGSQALYQRHCTKAPTQKTVPALKELSKL